jgi:hypothetical protein
MGGVTMLTQRVKTTVQQRLPKPAYGFMKRRYDDARALAGRNPGRGRMLPEFFVIGAAKSGTTTLYGWMSEHPVIGPASKKEVHYFDLNFWRGRDWYRSHFPLEADSETCVRDHGRPLITGEASPTYISHEWAPARLAKALPRAKLIVVFRNPVERAYSQFQMSRREGVEPLESFAEALAVEEERLRPHLERLRADPYYYGWSIGCWSYLFRSEYANQVARWLTLFPREQFHFLSTEELESDPQRALDGIYEYLDLPPYVNKGLDRLNTAPSYESMDPKVRADLVEYFRPRNERLYELVGIDFGWDR